MHHSHIDRFASSDSAIHRLDARAKLLATVAYTTVLISYGRYSVSALAPLAIGPAVLLVAARVPLRFVLRRILVLSPFILMLCALSPLYDRPTRLVLLGPQRLWIAGGWLTAADVALKFALAVAAMTALISSTSFSLLLEALRRLRVPRALTTQLGLLYRYLFVLLDQAMRMRRGRDFRGAALVPLRRRWAAAGGVVGRLFLRTLDRSQRVQTAMAARGFRGEPRGLRRMSFGKADVLFLALTALYLAACRWAYPAVFGGET